MTLTLTEQTRDGVTIVTVSGDVDVYTSPDLRRVLRRVSRTGQHRVLVDLTGCTYLDAAGLAVITIGLARARARGGELVIACDNEQVLKVFRVTGLAKVLPIFGSAADAAHAAPVGLTAPAAPGDQP